MKLLSVITVSCFIFENYAFPTALEKHFEGLTLESDSPSLAKRVLFDPVSQYISTTGDNAFVPPGPTDQRGPCPGLNAMANQ